LKPITLDKFRLGYPSRNRSKLQKTEINSDLIKDKSLSSNPRSISQKCLRVPLSKVNMPETVEKPEERDVGELMERFKQSARDAVEGKTSKIEEVKDRIEGKK
jgi:ubiquinone biosynthesis protein UbiJ